MSSQRAVAPRRARPQVEQLETREVLSAPTAYEQLLLERLNDARANPAAYGQSIGLDLSGVAAAQPLAWDTRLIQAARGHSQDMNDRNFFGHSNPSGQNAGARISAAGFTARSWGESIAAGYSGPDEAIKALIIDDGVPNLGHRKHLLAIDSVFRDQNLVGAGVVLGGTGAYGTYFTIDTASESNARPYLTGVVYSDANRNGRYDLNEGLGGVTVTVQGGPSVTTFASGGYSIRLNTGTYAVTFSGGGLGTVVTRDVTLGGTNQRLNITPGTPSTVTQASLASDPNAAWLAGVYENLLRRTPGENDYSYWLGGMRAGMSRDAVVAAISGSAEYIQVQGAAWINHVYRGLLGREAAQPDYDYWLWILRSGVTREGALTMMMGSAQYAYAENARWVGQVYQSLLERDARAEDVNYWTWVLAQGVTREQAIGMITQSAEFTEGLGGDFTAWLDRVYRRVLGRAAGAADVAYWAPVAGAAGQYAAAVQIAGSAEAQRHDAGLWVTQLYRDLLGRQAGAADVAYWLWAMQVGGSRASTVIAFATSPEFTTRVASSQ